MYGVRTVKHFCNTWFFFALFLSNSSLLFQLYPKKSTVFVGNLYVKVTEEDIRRAFEENVGPVRNVRIIRDPTVYISKVN